MDAGPHPHRVQIPKREPGIGVRRPQDDGRQRPGSGGEVGDIAAMSGNEGLIFDALETLAESERHTLSLAIGSPVPHPRDRGRESHPIVRADPRCGTGASAARYRSHARHSAQTFIKSAFLQCTIAFTSTNPWAAAEVLTYKSRNLDEITFFLLCELFI